MVWRRSVNREHVHPVLVSVMDQVLRKLAHSREPFKVYSGLRTYAEQAKLYEQGRVTVGKIVTKAQPGQSMHNYGLAVDLAPLNTVTDDDDVWWPDPEERSGVIWFHLENILLEVTQEMDIELDVEWGGRWKFRDVPHVQIRTSLRELQTGYFPVADIEWLVKSHTTFLYNTEWMGRRVQRLLNELGHDAGPVDGVIGMRTRRAMGRVGGTRVTKALVENLLRRHFDF